MSNPPKKTPKPSWLPEKYGEKTGHVLQLLCPEHWAEIQPEKQKQLMECVVCSLPLQWDCVACNSYEHELTKNQDIFKKNVKKIKELNDEVDEEEESEKQEFLFHFVVEESLPEMEIPTYQERRRDDTPPENWASIDPWFSEVANRNKWIYEGFIYNEVRDWINIGLNFEDYRFVGWLKKVKKMTSEQVLNHSNLQELRDEFAAKPPKTNAERIDKRLNKLQDEAYKYLESGIGDVFSSVYWNQIEVKLKMIAGDNEELFSQIVSFGIRLLMKCHQLVPSNDVEAQRKKMVIDNLNALIKKFVIGIWAIFKPLKISIDKDHEPHVVKLDIQPIAIEDLGTVNALCWTASNDMSKRKRELNYYRDIIHDGTHLQLKGGKQQIFVDGVLMLKQSPNVDEVWDYEG